MAFVLSVLALAWTMFTTWIRWPRIDVHIAPLLTAAPTCSDPADNLVTKSIRLVVVNLGAEAASIADAGLSVRWGAPHHGFEVGVGSARDHDDASIDGPELPARIEAHGCLVWTFAEGSIARIPRGSSVRGFVHRYRRYRKYPKRLRFPLKVVESNVAYVRRGGPQPLADGGGARA